MLCCRLVRWTLCLWLRPSLRFSLRTLTSYALNSSKCIFLAYVSAAVGEWLVAHEVLLPSQVSAAVSGTCSPMGADTALSKAVGSPLPYPNHLADHSPAPHGEMWPNASSSPILNLCKDAAAQTQRELWNALPCLACQELHIGCPEQDFLK